MQLSLLDYRPLARHTDRETSHVAAEQARHFASDHHAKILRYLQSVDPVGKHYIAIAGGTGLERHAVARRLPELLRGGFIFIVDTAVLPGTNRRGTLYRIAGKGQRRAA